MLLRCMIPNVKCEGTSVIEICTEIGKAISCLVPAFKPFSYCTFYIWSQGSIVYEKVMSYVINWFYVGKWRQKFILCRGITARLTGLLVFMSLYNFSCGHGVYLLTVFPLSLQFVILVTNIPIIFLGDFLHCSPQCQPFAIPPELRKQGPSIPSAWLHIISNTQANPLLCERTTSRLFLRLDILVGALTTAGIQLHTCIIKVKSDNCIIFFHSIPQELGPAASHEAGPGITSMADSRKMWFSNLGD
jgi:hypothetical protein